MQVGQQRILLNPIEIFEGEVEGGKRRNFLSSLKFRRKKISDNSLPSSHLQPFEPSHDFTLFALSFSGAGGRPPAVPEEGKMLSGR
jgi:hypothetical protein